MQCRLLPSTAMPRPANLWGDHTLSPPLLLPPPLQSTPLLLQNGSVAEAISLWKRNVDKEFEGTICVHCTLPAASPRNVLARLLPR